MMSASRARFISALVLFVLSALTATTFAQDSQPEDLPIGRYVADARLHFPKFKQDPAISGALGVATDNLPTRGLGFVFGAHFYPLRLGILTLGLGGEISKAGRNNTKNTGTEAAPVDVTVNTSFSAV